METQKPLVEISSEVLHKVTAFVLHAVMGPDHPLATHGDHLFDKPPVDQGVTIET